MIDVCIVYDTSVLSSLLPSVFELLLQLVYHCLLVYSVLVVAVLVVGDWLHLPKDCIKFDGLSLVFAGMLG